MKLLHEALWKTRANAEYLFGLLAQPQVADSFDSAALRIGSVPDRCSYITPQLSNHALALEFGTCFVTSMPAGERQWRLERAWATEMKDELSRDAVKARKTWDEYYATDFDGVELQRRIRQESLSAIEYVELLNANAEEPLPAKSPSDWAKEFKVTTKTLQRWKNSGKIHPTVITPKQWQLPAIEVAMLRKED